MERYNGFMVIIFILLRCQFSSFRPQTQCNPNQNHRELFFCKNDYRIHMEMKRTQNSQKALNLNGVGGPVPPNFKTL